MTPEQRQALENRKALLTRKKELLAQKAATTPTPEPEEAGYLERVGDSLAAVPKQALNLAGSAASGVNQMIKDTANLPFQASGWLNEQAGDIFGYDAKSYDLNDIPVVEDIGARVVPEGESAVHDFIRTGAEWGSGGMLSKAPTLAKSGGDALMGGMAALGELIGGDEGEMLGGLWGLKKAMKGDTLASTATSIKDKVADRIPYMNAESKALRAEGRAGDSAVKFIEQNLADAPTAKANLVESVDEGLSGTLTDATGDLGVGAVEMLGRDTPASQLAITDALRGREQQVVDTVAAPFGDVAKTGDAARTSAQETIAGTQKRVADARVRAEDAVTDATEAGLVKSRAAAAEAESAADAASDVEQGLSKALADVDPTAASSTKAAQTIDEGEALFKAEVEDPAWSEFRDGDPMPAAELQAGVKAELGKLTEEAQRGLKKAYPDVFKDINAWKGDISPSSVQYVRNSITDALNKVEKGGFGQLETGMIGIRDRIDNVIESGNRADAWLRGKAATQRKNEMFNTGDVGRQRKRADQQAFLEKLPYAGDQGKVTAQSLKATEQPEVIAAAQDWFRGRNKNKTIDQKFIDANDGFLSEFPELKAEYQAVADAGATTKEGRALAKAVAAEQGKKQTALMGEQTGGLKQARARADQRAGQTDKTVLGQYAKDPTTAIKRALKSPDDTSGIQSLTKRMERAGQLDSFKADVRKVLTDELSSMNTGNVKVKTNAVDNLADMRKPLLDSGLVSPQEFDKMMKLAARNARGSTIRQRMSALQTPASADEATNLEASVIAASLGALVPTGSQLMVAGALRRAVKKQLSRAEVNDRTLRKIDEFVANPEAFMKAMDKRDIARLKKAKSADEYAQLIVPKLVAGGQVVSDEQ